jgi:hypothetical protein
MNSFEVSIKVAEGKLAPKFDKSTPEEIKKVAQTCLSRDQKERPTFKQLIRQLQAIQQDWVKNGVPDHLAAVMQVSRKGSVLLSSSLYASQTVVNKSKDKEAPGTENQYNQKKWWLNHEDVEVIESLAYGSYFKVRKCKYTPNSKPNVKKQPSQFPNAVAQAGSIFFTRPARRLSLTAADTSSGTTSVSRYVLPEGDNSTKSAKGALTSPKRGADQRRRSSLSFRFKKGAPQLTPFASALDEAVKERIVIVKSFNIGKRTNLIQKFVDEMDVRIEMGHPNVTSIVGGWIRAESLFIMTPAAPYGTLRDIILTTSKRPQLRIHELLQVLNALQFLHSRKKEIVHKDLRSSKILCYDGPMASLTDFPKKQGLAGPSKKGNDDEVNKSQPGTPVSGDSGPDEDDDDNNNDDDDDDDDESAGGYKTKRPRKSFDIKLTGFMFDFLPKALSHEEQKLGEPAYSPPEVVLGETYLPASDIYSFGMVMWEVISGKEPFSNMSFEEIGRAVCMTGQRPELPPYDPNFNCDQENYDAFCEIIRNCWEADFTKRPTIPQLTERLSAIKTTIY